MIKKTIPILVCFIALSFFIFVNGLPEPPESINNVSTSSHNTSGNYSIAGAMAGNVTYVTINANGTTKTWAAYYGNISGTLRLENGQGNAIYQWTVTNPGGKIMATETVVTDWTGIYCWNWSRSVADGYKVTEWNQNFSVSAADVDRVNNTFDANYDYTTFYVAGNQFTNGAGGDRDGGPDTCPATQLFNESGSKQVDMYEEVILARLAQDQARHFDYKELIYLSLIEPNGIGFDGQQIDFQLIVPNDQHGTNSALSTYYFYVELEAS
jgi:hypothetical protein